MKQLGNVKIEVWLSSVGATNFKTLAEQLGLKPATLARRALNYFSRGGIEFSRMLTHDRYD